MSRYIIKFFISFIRTITKKSCQKSMKIIKLTALSLLTISVYSETKPFFQTGDKWYLNANSNKLSPTNSKVLYFMPNDAYHTYRARKFGDWDVFSIVDSRNIERLNKGDAIEIIDTKYNDKVLEVKLLSGFNKGKNFFIITEDLERFYKLSDEDSYE